MTPFYFGTSQRRLFGIYDPARSSADKPIRAALLCYPWGSEYIYAHRALRHLATRLSQAGFHTLRFDYFGTGDSAGEMVDADLVGWEDDIETAIEELMDLSGANQLVLIGLRLGATLAASVAARRPEVKKLVMWDPIVFGEAYLKDLSRLVNASAELGERLSERVAAQDGDCEVLGFPLTRKMAEELKDIDLTATIPALSADSLIVISQHLPWHGELQRAAKQQADSLPLFQYTDDAAPWLETTTFAGIVPVNTLDLIVSWLGQCA